MKKITSFFLVVFFIFGSTSTLSATDRFYGRKNDISVEYGFSIQDIAMGLGLLGVAIGGAASENPVKLAATGTIGVEYNRSLGRVISLGAVVNYGRSWGESIDKTTSLDVLCAMASMKAYWFKTQYCAMYTRVGLGFGLIGSKAGTENPYKIDMIPAAQLSAVSIEFGSWIRGFVELGAGMQGFALAGLKFSF